MKFVIVGGVAAGTKAAAKLKRENPQDEIVLYTKGDSISYAGCGLPYYVGGLIESREQLVVNTPQKFTELTGVPVHTGCEMIRLDSHGKTIAFANGESVSVSYDKLILAVGAEPVVPPVEGVHLPGVFSVRTPDDAVSILDHIKNKNCKRAAVIGGGFIGLEMAENLKRQGLDVLVLDMAPQLMSGIFDTDMADYARRQLVKRGLRVLTGTSLREIRGSSSVEAIRTDAGEFQADLVILSAGIRPATRFLEDSGLAMEKGAIRTDDRHCTNLPDVYAVGDCALVTNRITAKPQWSAMGSTANIAGRALALNLSGEEFLYPGVLGTGVVRLADDLSAARTGLTEQQALEAGFDAESVVCVLDDKPHYYPGASIFSVKLIADKASHRLLGLQVFGSGAVDKMADVAVTAISMNARLEDLIPMDFSYAPPFSTAIHPMAAACSILLNKITGRLNSITPAQYSDGKAADYRLVDAQSKPSLPGLVWFDLEHAEASARQFNPDEKLLLVCTKGRRAYLSQLKLRAMGFSNVLVLEGGASFNQLRRSRPAGTALPPEEIKRVKGLGCLQDKRYPDIFNVRVITRNGLITADEQYHIAQAAKQFGSGQITMTTRLTLEIQGVPFNNIDPLLAYLNENNLETGGTGSLVRPIVSCKGTTCQYGLIDTFGLSEKLHERFYEGYHTVTLPHKFKIAVGGCPNNCVKPNLNDLGIVGQRLPILDLSKCRGCKVCQVEKACPIHVAHLEDGLLHVDDSACNHCGRCLEKCPFGVTTEYQNGYRIYLGGRWGKQIAHGRPLDHFFTSEEEVLDLVERAILLFRSEGITGERFADTVTRLGFEEVQKRLLEGTIDRSAVLAKQVTGGATC